jgi:hypothetical protein
MTTAIIVSVEEKADILPSTSLEQAREFARHSKAASTLRGYRADWRNFTAWCEAHGVGALPVAPETVAAYIAESTARLNVGSIQRRVNAIGAAHKAAGLASPAGECRGHFHAPGHPANTGHCTGTESPGADR